MVSGKFGIKFKKNGRDIVPNLIKFIQVSRTKFSLEDKLFLRSWCIVKEAHFNMEDAHHQFDLK